MKKGLGKGLGALIQEVEDIKKEGILELRIIDIEPNSEQPRKYFDQEKLKVLSE